MISLRSFSFFWLNAQALSCFLSFLAIWPLSAWWGEKTVDSCSFLWLLLGLCYGEVSLDLFYTDSWRLWSWLSATNNNFSVSFGPNSQVSSDTGSLNVSSSHPQGTQNLLCLHMPCAGCQEQEIYFSSHFSELLSYAAVLHIGFESIIPESSSQGSLGNVECSKQNRGSTTCFQFSLSLYKMPFLTGILAQRRGVGTYVSHDLPLHPS